MPNISRGRSSTDPPRPRVTPPLATGVTRLSDLSQRFSTDGQVRTQLASALAAELRVMGIDSNEVNISMAAGPNGELTEFIIGGTSSDPLLQLQVADAAMRVLREQGVDLRGINPLDPTTNPLAWNVVYKDGGWVVNG